MTIKYPTGKDRGSEKKKKKTYLKRLSQILQMGESKDQDKYTCDPDSSSPASYLDKKTKWWWYQTESKHLHVSKAFVFHPDSQDLGSGFSSGVDLAF